jgi:hypothetical protein
MADELPGDDELGDTETGQEPDADEPGFLRRQLTPVGARALALAGFVALALGPLDSRSSVSRP